MRVAALVLVLGGSARADTPKPLAPDHSHVGQFEASLRVPIGLRAIATYDKGTYCGVTDSTAALGVAPVCTGRAPFSFDFELGYGVHRRIDAILELRV
ncbi:MAG: hypothetical protein WKG01_42400, partial [Kofleriaceae bacterium]